MTASATTAFKQCPMCQTTWADVRDLVLDREVRVEGYMASFADPGLGLVLLTHRRHRCGTTLAIRAEAFRPLYDGPQYTEHRTGTERCPRLCLKQTELAACDADCDMAWVRMVIQYLHHHELPPHLAATAGD